MRDIAVQENGDIYLGEDIVITNTISYHKKNVMLMKKGDLKHAPGIGVNIRNYVNSYKTEKMLRAIRRNFTKVGINVVSLKLENNTLIEQGTYEGS